MRKLYYEKKAYAEGFTRIAGIDEAGRGPLAGPVVACACVIPLELHIDGVNDSKQLTPLQRERLFLELTENPQVEYGVGIVDEKAIDEINIFQATIQAMNLAVENLPKVPDFLLVDGLKLPSAISSEKIIKGDTLSFLIGAASIIAKVVRDRLMKEYHQQWPHYGFDTHKGYGTKKHRDAIEKHGPCPIHRKTFEPVKSWLN